MSSAAGFEQAIGRLQRQWHMRLPETFLRLYRGFDYPFISPCEFLSLDELIADEERWRGMLPQFTPFGHDGEENYFGFYAHARSLGSDYAVLRWDHEYDHYHPIGCTFDAFLRWCVLYGRYLAQDSFDEAAPEFEEEEAQRREFAELVGLPASLVTDAVPRNDRELLERILRSDSQNAYALAQLGAVFMGRGEVERARDCFVRSSEATPWFGDPYYLLGETYRVAGAAERACGLWWQVLTVPIALSTRTTSYAIGGIGDVEEAEIYEAAAGRCLEYCDALDPDAQRSPLMRLLTDHDPYVPAARLALADQLSRVGDRVGLERELLNALTLATEDRDVDASYSRLIAFYEAAGAERDAELCRRDSQRD